MISAILKLLGQIAAAFSSWLETHNTRTLERLDREADDLRRQIRDAAERGEHHGVVRLQTTLQDNRIRAKTLRDAAKPQGEGRN